MRRKRIDNWPRAMRETLAHHRDTPFVWGVSDCSLFADVVAAITGYDPIAGIRGYSSEVGALLNLRRQGYERTLDLIATEFVEIDPSKAQRGDLGYPADIPHRLMSPAVIDGAFAYSKAPGDGWVVFPVSRLTRTFAV